ncbi:phosphatidylinositol-glycan biosynthesis class w protein [Holotrichia oblita]|uniref:Tbc1 domain family member 20/gtpase n=2 Tax=Holotrichia oblita TaxID=644536 RepID=A0ACB9TI78_HOLOL|nr:tbc1 domain family member 20/gtpase [Holotrichia oblita]KAI4466482.1 phosphatidylinositol-glycan biosynthesis class w protein [Holotrichia oblita]
MYNKTIENKQIEDIIDARKRNGEYNFLFNRHKCSNSQSTYRYAYSTPRGYLEDKLMVPDESAMWNIEGDLNSDRDGNVISIGPTDSEITVVRVKRESSQLKESENNWDMHDKAIPGDGTHLGESPSLVNLVTLVHSSKESLITSNTSGENVEYMVPLSSWDPLDETLEILQQVDSDTSKSFSVESVPSDQDGITGVVVEESQDVEVIKPPVKVNQSNLAGRLSVFLRKCFRKHKNSNPQ